MSYPDIPLDVPIIGADEALTNELSRRSDTARSGNRIVVPTSQQATPKLRQSLKSALMSNQRKQARYPFSRPLICYPVLESHEIASSYALPGIGVDIGTGGMKIRVDVPEPLEGMEVVVAVDAPNGQALFAAGTVMNCKGAGTGMEHGIAFRGFMNEVLQSEHIIPVLDSELMQYQLPYSDVVLASLCKVGAATTIELDKVMLCPDCRGIPTFRHGCSLCLSSDVKTSQMIHHFACAHVDFVDAFESEDNELMCPKCRTRRMLVGSDYEYLDGPNMCQDCGQANLEKILIGHCLSCECRFPAANAIEFKMLGYRVSRLDVLAFIN